MLVNKRKIRRPALSSIVCQQAGPWGQTLRARQICPLSALDRLENQRGILRLSACSAGKSASAEWMKLVGPDPNVLRAESEMSQTAQCKLGIVLEKRASDSPWLDHEWVTIGVTLDVVDSADWVALYETEERSRYLSPAVDLELHRAETEAYLYNLQSPEPSLFAVLRHERTTIA